MLELKSNQSIVREAFKLETNDVDGSKPTKVNGDELEDITGR